MSFLGTSIRKKFQKIYKIQEKKDSLQALVFNNKAYTDPLLNTNKYLKRISLNLSFKISAGITVEAAIALPLFIFFMVNLISIINLFNLYSEKISKVQQIARSIAFTSCNIDQIGYDLVTEVQPMIIKPPVPVVGYKGTSTNVSMTYKKWTGYDLFSETISSKDEEYVYITSYGYTYHRNRECSHLSISIMITNINEIDLKRNDNNGKYYPCEKCGGNGTGLLFITSQGDRYHSSASCSGLKRNIKTIKISEVGARIPCSVCGG